MTNEKSKLEIEEQKIKNEKSKLEIEEQKIKNENDKIDNRKTRLDIIRENLVDPKKLDNPTIELVNGSKFAIEGYTLAAESLGELVTDLYQSLKSSKSLKRIDYLIMANKDDISISSLEYYNDFNGQISLFNKAYNFILGIDKEDISKPNPPESLLQSSISSGATTSLALQGILQAISAFRTDVKIQSIDVELDESVLVAQLAALFEKDQNTISLIDSSKPTDSCIPPKIGRTRVFYPQLFPIHLSRLEGEDKCEKVITEKLDKISKKVLQGKIIIKELKAKQKELQENDSDLSQEEKEKLENLSLLDKKFTEIFSSIYFIDSEGISNLSLLKTGLKIRQMLENTGGYLMLFQMKTGGSVRTTSNLFGTKVRYSGGASVSFFFFDNESSIIFSDALQHHTGFKKLDTGITTSIRSPKN